MSTHASRWLFGLPRVGSKATIWLVRLLELWAFGQGTAPLKVPISFQPPVPPAKEVRASRLCKPQLIRRRAMRFIRAFAAYEKALQARLQPYIGGGLTGAVVVALNGCTYAFHEVHGGVLSSPYQRLQQLVVCCLFGSCLWGQQYSAWARFKVMLGGAFLRVQHLIVCCLFGSCRALLLGGFQRVQQPIVCCLFGSCFGGQRYSA